MKVSKKFFPLLLLLCKLHSTGNLQVVTTYDISETSFRRIGKDRIEVVVLARGDYNPHIIVPKPLL